MIYDWNWCVVKKSKTRRKEMQALAERAARADVPKALAILKRAGVGRVPV
jgi:hypothetical protein